MTAINDDIFHAGGDNIVIGETNPLSDGKEYTFEFVMLDSSGQPVTVIQTAIWHAE